MKESETAQYEGVGMGLVHPSVPDTESPNGKPKRHMLM